jgi:hypothetical protein
MLDLMMLMGLLSLFIFVCYKLLLVADALADGRRVVGPHRPQQRMRVVLHQQQAAVLGLHEAFGDAALHHLDQRLVIGLHIEQADGLAVEAELGPGEDLEELLEGAQPARQGDETVGQLGHAGLAGVHRIDHLEAGQASWPTSHSSSARGITPTTRPPAARQASATMPIRPTLPPPYTSSMPRSASSAPTASAAAR